MFREHLPRILQILVESTGSWPRLCSGRVPQRPRHGIAMKTQIPRDCAHGPMFRVVQLPDPVYGFGIDHACLLSGNQ